MDSVDCLKKPRSSFTPYTPLSSHLKKEMGGPLFGASPISENPTCTMLKTYLFYKIRTKEIFCYADRPEISFPQLITGR